MMDKITNFLNYEYNVDFDIKRWQVGVGATFLTILIFGLVV